MAKKRKDFHKQEILARKSTLQSLEFLISFGLKQIGVESTFHEHVDAELKDIIELDLCKDLLEIKKLVDAIRLHFAANAIKDKGDFCNSYVCIALGISHVEDIHNIKTDSNIWKELLKQKLIPIYYPEEIRNKVIAWANENGYTTSTYLGQPIIKFSKLFLLIKRAA